ncbi:EamA family transporter RarD [bacterium]|nr:EamA family transporter RarD [bacterium]
MNKGGFYAAGAYLIWGLFPLFWKALQSVPPLEILAHRVVWSMAFLVVLLALQRNWNWLPAALRDGRIAARYAASGLLLMANWFIFIWAVNTGRVVEASLGYFITPLLNVGLGVVCLNERLRPLQGVAIAIAAGGVVALTLVYGALPWAAFALALTFALYGLLRKTSPLGSLEGLTLETLFVCVPALIFLLTREVQHAGVFGHGSATTSWLLVSSGAVTALPLLLFAAGAKRVPMTLLGVLQYIAPTMQFLLGAMVYQEALDRARLLGFSLIWLALALYAGESLRRSKAPPALEVKA